MDSYQQLLECGYGPIVDMAMKCESVLATHTHALVSVSGGADSDVMVDLVERVRTVTRCHVTYVWFDTGLEYRATRQHISDMEDRYGIQIIRRRADITIPVCCRDFGQPFLSKYVSDMVRCLQSISFAWTDEPYDTLLERHSGKQTSALKWWCNRWTSTEKPGWYDIGRVRWLKEFMIEHPPQFRMSADCCKHAKKHVSRAMEIEVGADVLLTGVRRAEGGIRASHKTCFDHGHGTDTYRPMFWLTDADKLAYEQTFNVTHSDCYKVWGFTRTGCVGCPLNSRALIDIEVAGRYEPNMERAAKKVFADAYEYTRMWREWRDYMHCGMHRLF